MSFQDVPRTSDWDVPPMSYRVVPGTVKQDLQGTSWRRWRGTSSGRPGDQYLPAGYASAFNIIYLRSRWLMGLKNQYCFVSLFISLIFCLIEQTGCIILYRTCSSFHIAINSMISLSVHSLLPLLLFFFYIRLLPEKYKDTDPIKLTATLVLISVQYYQILQCFFVKFSSTSNARLPFPILKEIRRYVQNQLMGDVL